MIVEFNLLPLDLTGSFSTKYTQYEAVTVNIKVEIGNGLFSAPLSTSGRR